MTKEEIKIVTDIMLDADGGCGYCASSLCSTLQTRFPQYKKDIDDVFTERYGESVKEYSKRQ
jgi:hypothetical protein